MTTGRYPNLSERLGVEAEQLSSLLSQAITQELYQAAFGSAAVAYYGAYLDAVLGFAVLGTRYVSKIINKNKIPNYSPKLVPQFVVND